MDKQQLYLKPDEAKFLAMGVVAQLELLRETAKDQRINWNPKTRKDLKDMITAGESLHTKLVKLGIDMRDLPPYIDGDENDFLTKQS